MTGARRVARDARRQNRTAEKIRRARGPADEAAVAFDEVRKVIARDPDQGRRENRWRRLTQTLGEFASEIRTGDGR